MGRPLRWFDNSYLPLLLTIHSAFFVGMVLLAAFLFWR